MVIGFDASRAFINNRTGTENYSYQLLRVLSEIDHKNTYKVYVRPGFRSKDKWPSNFKFSILLLKGTRNFQYFWTQIGLALQTFKDNLDVLFVPAHTLPLVRKPGLKTVVTVHDLGSEYLPSLHQLKQRLYLGFMQRYQLKSATKLIAVSYATKDDLVRKVGINPKRVEMIYEGFNQELFKAKKEKNDTKGNSLRYFLFVGTVQPRKNLARVIQAFARYSRSLGNIHSSKSLRSEEVNISFAPSLVIAGGKGWLSDDIYELPKLLGIGSRVKFLGYVSDEKLPALYKGAEALLFPSLFEGFGLPILEAQACGCPVITSRVSSMPEVAGKGAILVDPYSVDDIVKGMERLQVTGYRLQLIKKGLENVKRFSWEKCAMETLKVLENV